jgi:hypothetical protein
MDSLAARWLDRAPAGWADLAAADPMAAPSHRPEVAAAFVAALPGFEQRFAAVERDGDRADRAAHAGRAACRNPLAALAADAPERAPSRAGEHAGVDVAVAGAIADWRNSVPPGK